VGEIIEMLPFVKNENMDMNSAQQILMYCSEHFREDINLKKVAAELYLSESYISKIFAKKLGYSFREYINTLRISEAKRMLKNADVLLIQEEQFHQLGIELQKKAVILSFVFMLKQRKAESVWTNVRR